MAIKAQVSFRDRLLPEAYLCVQSIAVDRSSGCRAVVWLYANEADRAAARAPADIFSITAPYNDQPYDAIYAELKKKYPEAIDV